MVGGNITTPQQPIQQQQQRKQSNLRSSAANPFTNDFFNQPFTLGKDEFGQFTTNDDNIASADPFSSTETTEVNKEWESTDDPFTAFEFDNTSKDNTSKEQTTTNEFDAFDAFASIRHRDSIYISDVLEQSQSEPPTVANLLEETSPDNTMSVDNSLTEPPPSVPPTSTDPFGASLTCGAVEEKQVSSWTTFDDRGKTSEPIYAVPDKSKKKRSSIASPVGAFDEAFSSVKSSNNPPPLTSTDNQIISPLQPPPRGRRSTNRKVSRPHTVYGDSSQADTTPKANKPLFDLSSIKAKAATTDQLEDKTSKDPFKDLFQRADANMDTTFF